jgi:hypothetical protein
MRNKEKYMDKNSAAIRESLKDKPVTAEFLVALNRARKALLDLDGAWDSLDDEEVISAVDGAYQEHLKLPNFHDVSYNFMLFADEIVEKFARDEPLQEATSGDYKLLGRYVKGMAIPGSSKVSDELFHVVNDAEGVHEKSLVRFFRGFGGLPSIDEEDIIEIEDLIDQAWKEGRKARGLKVTGEDDVRYS